MDPISFAIFSFLNRIARRAPDFFKIPQDAIIEGGISHGDLKSASQRPGLGGASGITGSFWYRRGDIRARLYQSGIDEGVAVRHAACTDFSHVSPLFGDSRISRRPNDDYCRGADRQNRALENEFDRIRELLWNHHRMV
ncbi:hypothetical protein [Bradyrhizobium sp.]|uniref:hypothetical protein n=1 Tax=Bradyrhizobium sp. TaxID=376 RepID=UPI003C76876C